MWTALTAWSRQWKSILSKSDSEDTTSFFSKAVFSAVMGLTAVTAVAAAPKYIFLFHRRRHGARTGDGRGDVYNRMTRGSDTKLLMMCACR